MHKLIANQESRDEILKGYVDYVGKTLKEQNQQIIDIANNISETFNVIKNKLPTDKKELELCQHSSKLLIEDKGESVMRGITLRSDGRYMIRKTIKGVQITRYAHTKEEARQLYVDMKRGKIKPTKRTAEKNISKSYITVNDYGIKWLETYKKPFLQPKNYSAVRSYIGRFTKVLGYKKLKDLTTEDIQDFLNPMKSGRYKEKICIYVNSMLQQAFDTGVINRNPFRAVVKDKKVKCKSYMYVFDEQERIIKAIKGTDIEHEIMTYLMCGCRPSEMPQNSQFDFNKNIINIYGTKNDNARHRIVEMSEDFSNYMKEYFKDREMQPQQYVSKKFRDICEKLKIEKASLYRLRHTFASNHFILKTQPKYVQEWLGHSGISITLDTYTDIDKTATKEKIMELYNNYYYIP